MLDILYQNSKISHKKRNWSFLKSYENDVIKLYKQGFGIANVAQKVFISDKISLGVKRSFVIRILKENNIYIRSQREQALLDYQIGVRNKYKTTHKANIATRGSKTPQNIKEKHAKTLEQRHIVNLRQSKYEQLLYDYLIKNKIPFTYQKAYKQYNADFVFQDLENKDVVVELTGGHFRNYNDEKFKRKKKCLFEMGVRDILIIRCDRYFNAKETYNLINSIINHIIEINSKRRTLKN